MINEENTITTLEEALFSKSMKRLAAAGFTAATIAATPSASAIVLNPSRVIDARGNTAADPFKADREAADKATQEKAKKEQAARETKAAEERIKKEKASNEWKNKLGAEFARGGKK